MGGYITIPRAVAGADWYRRATPLIRAFWLELVFLANWRTTRVRTGQVLKPGQLVTSWAALTRRMQGQERNRPDLEKATLKRCRRAGSFLRNEKIVAWERAGTRAGAGIIMTLTEWPSHSLLPSEGPGVGAGDRARTPARAGATPEEEDLPSCPDGQEGRSSTPPRDPLTDFHRRCEEGLRLIEEEERRQRRGLQDGQVEH